MTQRRALLLATLALPSLARAQDAWPTRSISLVAPFAPGGPVDDAARPFAGRADHAGPLRGGDPRGAGDEPRGGAAGEHQAGLVSPPRSQAPRPPPRAVAARG
jgi:hypothetical protein